MATQIKLRRDTAANWISTNPVLALGEPGLEIDTRKIKYGDGTTAWTSLAYSAGDANFSGNYTDLSNKPTIPDAQIQSDWTQSDNTLKDFIKNKPSIPAAQIQSDWTQTTNTELDFIKNKPTLVTNLDSLSDVTITSASNGQVLKYNGTAWINDTDSTGGGASTGNITFSGDNISGSDNVVRIRSLNTTTTASYNFTPGGGDYSTAVWDGQGITFNDPTQPIYDAIFALTNLSAIRVQVAGNWFTVTSSGSSTPGMPQAPTLFVNETAVSGPLNIDVVDIDIIQGTESYAEIDGSDFRVDVQDDIRIYGNDTFLLYNKSTTDSIQIETNDGDHTWEFNASGDLILPLGGDILDSTGTSVLGTGTLDSVTDNGSITTNSITVGSISLTNGSTITETANTTVITPPGALAGQSLVIRLTGAQGIVSDHPGGFADGDTITLTVTPDVATAPVTGTVDYTFTGCTSVELGRALTGTLTFTAESAKPISWTIPVSSTMTTFTITLSNASGFDISGISPLTLTKTGSSEDHHIHLIAGDPSITDIYLGDDDQYVKIEKNGGNVIIGTDTNSRRWTFDTNGNLTLPANTFAVNYANGTQVSLGAGSASALTGLTDVTVTSPTNGQVLKYDTATSKWINAADSTGGGGIALTDISVGVDNSASGTGSISYANTTGVFTYTPPDLTSYATTSSLSGYQVAGSYLTSADLPDLSGYALSSSVPAAQIQSDWTQATNTALDFIKNKPTLFSGDYDDLTDKPTSIQTVSAGSGPGGNDQANSLVLTGLNPVSNIPSTYGGDIILQPGAGGSNGDLYGEVRIKSGTVGSSYEWHFTSDKKIKLPQGGDIVDSTGTTVLGGGGTPGEDGADGRTILNGAVNPTTEGVDGDFYINTATNTLFGPKTAGVWSGTGVSLVGPAGADGVNGTDGAPGAAASISWSISASGTSDYIFSGPGIEAGNTNDPILYLYRGFTYTFVNTTASSHPFAIRVSDGGAAYTSGVTGSQTGTQTFTVPMNAPSTLYYQCTIHATMGNIINIV